MTEKKSNNMDEQQEMTAMTVTLKARSEPTNRADLENAFSGIIKEMGKNIQIIGGNLFIR